MKHWAFILLFSAFTLLTLSQKEDEDHQDAEFHTQDPSESIEFKTPSGSVCHYVEAHYQWSVAALFIDCECKRKHEHTQKYGCLYTGDPDEDCYNENREQFFKDIITIFESKREREANVCTVATCSFFSSTILLSAGDQEEACVLKEFDASNYTSICTKGKGPLIMKRRVIDGLDPSTCQKKHEEL